MRERFVAPQKLKALRQAQAAHARAVRAAKRAAHQNGHLIHLELERKDALLLFEVLDPMGDERAVKLRRQLVALAFGQPQ